ncbi:hypothetical protein [Microbacterium sp.]|uniref:hypothetical protein n=1 Tax=Microbacterium sp. TaxID=51671 RepID=UPI003C75989A
MSETPTPATKPTPVSLEGTWKQSNSKAEGSAMEATVVGQTITIDFIIDGGKTTALYWVGTVVVPQDGSTSFTWTSEADTAKLKNALLGSQDATKNFSYDNGVIRYEVTIQGQTAQVEMARAE